MESSERSTEEIITMTLELSEITSHKLEDQDLQIERDQNEIQRIRTLVHDKNTRIEWLEMQLLTESCARQSAEKKSDVSLMFCYVLSVFSIINVGFLVARYFL